MRIGKCKRCKNDMIMLKQFFGDSKRAYCWKCKCLGKEIGFRSQDAQELNEAFGVTE